MEVERVRWKKLVGGRRVGVKWDVTVQWWNEGEQWRSGEVDRYGLKCKGYEFRFASVTPRLRSGKKVVCLASRFSAQVAAVLWRRLQIFAWRACAFVEPAFTCR
ncbi:hypothetical protein E2C01_004403 [Portunus trituberculatus]|uniref:Uncharacterized protein n=1 Tax=Portunus trituberculatus TaxID=210409 RepID=A0A5B7CQF9_PORTR|nr:hypothetical protein [Portunus trituberculatus]